MACNVKQSQMLEECTKYKAADLQVCVEIMLDLYLSRSEGASKAVREKYKQHKVIDILQIMKSFDLISSIIYT